MKPPIESFIGQLFEQLQGNHQRQLVCIQGSQKWCDAQLKSLQAIDVNSLLFSNRDFAQAISFNRASLQLGESSNLVIVDLFQGLNPDLLCIASGLVRAGGVLVLFSPELKSWNLKQDKFARWQDDKTSVTPSFIEYFFDQLQAHEEIGIILTEGNEARVSANQPSLTPTAIVDGKTEQQQACLKQFNHFLNKNKRGLISITADRGRGKSWLLAIILSQLEATREFKILVTASSRQVAEQVLKPSSDSQCCDSQCLESKFIAPDKLIESLPQADLIIIDEAAMIPQSMLRGICRHYKWVIMATTTGGYEGTGQGFLLRFMATLKQNLNKGSLLNLTLDAPVRWCAGDNLEAWINQTLMMNNPSTAETAGKLKEIACEYFVLQNVGADFRVDSGKESKPARLQRVKQIKQVYELLRAAHYRTRPSDLRLLFENPDIVIIAARIDDGIVAAALINIEGGFDVDLCEEVFLGQRRPKGHLLAQMLTAQAGLRGFAKHRGLRIQRIAVADAYRRKGIASDLFEQSLDYAKQNQFDYVGACFAIDQDVLTFWKSLGCQLVHVSFAQGKSSGDFSVAVLKSVSSVIDQDLKSLSQRIEKQVALWLTQFLQNMDANSVVALLAYLDLKFELTQMEKDDLYAFSEGHRGLELCFASLQKFVISSISKNTEAVDGLLVQKLLQNRSWPSLQSGSDGRQQQQTRLRGVVRELLKASVANN